MTLKFTGIFTNDITGNMEIKTTNLLTESRESDDILARRANRFAEDKMLSEEDAIPAELPVEIASAFPELTTNDGVWSADLGGITGYVIAQYVED